MEPPWLHVYEQKRPLFLLENKIKERLTPRIKFPPFVFPAYQISQGRILNLYPNREIFINLTLTLGFLNKYILIVKVTIMGMDFQELNYCSNNNILVLRLRYFWDDIIAEKIRIDLHTEFLMFFFCFCFFAMIFSSIFQVLWKYFGDFNNIQ